MKGGYGRYQRSAKATNCDVTIIVDVFVTDIFMQHRPPRQHLINPLCILGTFDRLIGSMFAGIVGPIQVSLARDPRIDRRSETINRLFHSGRLDKRAPATHLDPSPLILPFVNMAPLGLAAASRSE